MPQKEERHLSDYRRVIVEAMRRLSDSENRFNEDAASSMRQTCLKDFPEPTFSEIAASDYGLPGDASDKEMAAEFWKEIQVLEQCLEELGCEIGLPEWQQHLSSKAAERMHKVLNRRAYALQLWDWYAIPVRHIAGKVLTIQAPGDAMGSPIIHSYDPGYFLLKFAEVQGKNQRELARLRRNADRWMTIAVIALFILACLVYAWVLEA